VVLLCINKHWLFRCRLDRQWHPRICCTI
jgi:hypothetical protein